MVVGKVNTGLNPRIERSGPFIVGIGGTLRSGSTSERALKYVMQASERLGATTEVFVGQDIDIPHYNPESPIRNERAQALVSAMRKADAIVLATPGYHGSISGMVKNAIDYVEDMRGDERVYFAGRPVGCIVAAAGWQSVGATLVAMRSIVHALRGWPTPFGIGINSRESVFDAKDPMFEIMAGELVNFGLRQHQSIAADCSPSAPLRQIEGLHGGRISGSS